MLIKLVLVLLSVLLFLESFSRIYRAVIVPLHDRLSFWFVNRKTDEPEVEEPIDEFLNGSYDVEAFRDRIRKLTMDENGLYDEIPENYSKTDFTGVEIITSSAEVMADKKAGR